MIVYSRIVQTKERYSFVLNSVLCTEWYRMIKRGSKYHRVVKNNKNLLILVQSSTESYKWVKTLNYPYQIKDPRFLLLKER